MVPIEEARNMMYENMMNLRNIYEGIPPIVVFDDGRIVGYCDDAEAIRRGFIRDPNKPFTLRERITRRVRDWHSRMAVYHERRSIGLK